MYILWLQMLYLTGAPSTKLQPWQHQKTLQGVWKYILCQVKITGYRHTPSYSTCMWLVFVWLVVCSLPRHKPSGTIKGFSFIEFTTTEEAAAALEVHVYTCMSLYHKVLCLHFSCTIQTVYIALDFRGTLFLWIGKIGHFAKKIFMDQGFIVICRKCFTSLIFVVLGQSTRKELRASKVWRQQL